MAARWIVVGFLLALCSTARPARAQTEETLQWEGIELAYPSSWEVLADRLVDKNDPGTANRILHLASSKDEKTRVEVILSIATGVPDVPEDDPSRRRPGWAGESFVLPLVVRLTGDEDGKNGSVSYGTVALRDRSVGSCRIHCPVSGTREFVAVEGFGWIIEGKQMAVFGAVVSRGSLAVYMNDDDDLHRAIGEAYRILSTVGVDAREK